MALPDALKKAILLLPGKEKDRLLLRLVGKDKLLVERLNFELIEEKSTLAERREAIRDQIRRTARTKQHSAGWIMMDMRTLSGEITRHVKITRDKYGEVELNIRLLNEFFDQQEAKLRSYSPRADRCALYIARKTRTILRLLGKLDEDYYVDFQKEMNTLLHRVHTMCPRTHAQTMEIPRQWP